MGLADPSPHLIAAGQTDPGQRRALNEDAWRIADASHLGGVIEERGQLFAVADGMGGHAAGEVASELAIETLFAEYYASDDAPMSPAMRLEQAILTANARIYEQAGARASQAGMGTTIVAAVVHGEWLTIANVGDSRAYLVRDGTVQQLTRDHSWVAEQVTAGLLTEQQAQGHMYRNVVTRCLGHSAQIEVDTFEQVLQPSDVVLLCSDGLSNQVSEEELARVIAEQAPTEAVAELIELANRYGGPDNITAVLIVLQEEPSEAVTVVSAPRPEPQVAQTPPAKAAAPAAPSAKPAPARRSPSPLLKWGVPLVLVLSASCIVGIVLTVWGPEALWGWFITSTATPSVDGASATETPDETATATASATAAPSATWTATVPVIATPTHTVAPTSTATSTPTATSTSTMTPTATSTPLPTTTRQITG